MMPSPDSKELSLAVLNEKITGLKIVFQELSALFNTSPDPEFRSSLRPKLTQINGDIFFFESQRNAIAAITELVTPPSAAEVADVEDALKKLDGFVRSDENFHASARFLQDVAAQLKG